MSQNWVKTVEVKKQKALESKASTKSKSMFVQFFPFFCLIFFFCSNLKKFRKSLFLFHFFIKQKNFFHSEAKNSSRHSKNFSTFFLFFLGFFLLFDSKDSKGIFCPQTTKVRRKSKSKGHNQLQTKGPNQIGNCLK